MRGKAQVVVRAEVQDLRAGRNADADSLRAADDPLLLESPRGARSSRTTASNRALRVSGQASSFVLRDLQDHLSAVPGLHGLEPLCGTRSNGKRCVSTGRDVQAALQHGLHLVPGLEDLPAVDALDDEPLKITWSQRIPVELGRIPRSAMRPPWYMFSSMDSKAVPLPDISRPMSNPMIPSSLRASSMVVRRHVDRQRGSHLRGQAQAVVVDVRDHDPLRAAVPADGRRHDADGPGARDQHVLTDQVEGQGGVGGVAQRVEEAGDLRRDAGVHVPGVGRGQREVLRKAAVPVHADAHGVGAQVAAPGPAASADAADDVAFPRDPLPDLVAADVRAHCPRSVPTNSWPVTMGGLMVRWDHSSQFQMWRSVPQIAAFVTFTRRSLPPICGTGTSCSSRPLPADFFTRAFMARIIRRVIRAEAICVFCP